MRNILIGLIALIFIPAFVIAQTDTPQSDEQQRLAKGKELFETKCSMCHSIQRPLNKNYNRQKWNKVLSKMAENMKNKRLGELTDEEKVSIVNYLVNAIPPKK
jgi:cytochrome c5